MDPGADAPPDPWDRPENPADPAMSALPGHEKKSYVAPLSIGIGVLLLAVIAFLVMPRGPRQPYLVLTNPEIGFSAEYPSELIQGPNFVKTRE